MSAHILETILDLHKGLFLHHANDISANPQVSSSSIYLVV